MSDLPSNILTMPVEPFKLASGLGTTKIWELVASGELQSIVIGSRRLIVIDSYRRLIEKKLAEGPDDARRNSTVPALGTKRGVGRPRKTPAEVA